MGTDDCDEVERIARNVLGYLDAHPHAADTLEGVVNWWLVQQRYMWTEDLVRRALKSLIEEGKVVAVQTPDGRQIFSKVVSAMDMREGN